MSPRQRYLQLFSESRWADYWEERMKDNQDFHERLVEFVLILRNLKIDVYNIFLTWKYITYLRGVTGTTNSAKVLNRAVEMVVHCSRLWSLHGLKKKVGEASLNGVLTYFLLTWLPLLVLRKSLNFSSSKLKSSFFPSNFYSSSFCKPQCDWGEVKPVSSDCNSVWRLKAGVGY